VGGEGLSRVVPELKKKKEKKKTNMQKGNVKDLLECELMIQPGFEPGSGAVCWMASAYDTPTLLNQETKGARFLILVNCPGTFGFAGRRSLLRIW
jgi:hypothetical protein